MKQISRPMALWRTWPSPCWLVIGSGAQQPVWPDMFVFTYLKFANWLVIHYGPWDLLRHGENNFFIARGICSNEPRTIPASSCGPWGMKAAGVPTSPLAPKPCASGIRSGVPCSMKGPKVTVMRCSSAEMAKAKSPNAVCLAERCGLHIVFNDSRLGQMQKVERSASSHRETSQDVLPRKKSVRTHARPIERHHLSDATWLQVGIHNI